VSPRLRAAPSPSRKGTLACRGRRRRIEPLRRNATLAGDASGHEQPWRVAGLASRVRALTLRIEILISRFQKISLEEQVELPRVPS